ncbi:MAG: GTP-dependent dephospho-CoA kinase family protein [Thermoplasmata archaeon]
MQSKLDRDLVLPEKLRKELSIASGILMQTEDLKNYLSDSDTVYSVGDMTTDTLIKNGYIPKIAIFDNKTKRGPINIDPFKAHYQQIKKVFNPQGKITIELWNVIKEAINSDTYTAIEVDGEEDLAALPCIYMAKENVKVIYGIPDTGMNMIIVDQKIKKKVEKILKLME